MKIEVEVSPEWESELIRNGLVFQYKTSKEFGDPEYDIPLQAALKTVIEHYSTPDQLDKLEEELGED